MRKENLTRSSYRILIFILILTSYVYTCNADVNIDNNSPSTVPGEGLPNQQVQNVPQGIDPTYFVEQAWDKLRPGWILFKCPNETRVGDTESIEMRITRNITNEFRENLSGRGIPEISNIEKIGTRMRPELRAENGSAFEIIPQFSQDYADRPILLGKFSEWDWNIMPLSSGNQKLILEVFTTIEIPSLKPYPVQTPVFTKIVVVRVNPLYTIRSWLMTYWQWLVGLIVTFILGRRSKK